MPQNSSTCTSCEILHWNKRAYEKLLAQANRRVKHYHADNGRFADNGFLEAVNTKNQKITFCGVGAHHQNGIIENKNIILKGARTLLLHGMGMWPQMINSMFWPFAFKAMA
jgi:starvation-inducible outer membrane lipoprotein